MEKAVFMMDYLNVTQQANGSYSHQGDKAIDIAGKDSGIENFKAPFTGIIKKTEPVSNAVWLESIDKVKYADGTVDYMTIMTAHDNDISNIKVGMKINQGQIYYQEGKKGNATGNHIHLAVGKGKFTGTGWYKNKNGLWCINNQYDVHKGLFLLDTVKVLNSGGYNWIKTNTLNEGTPTSNTFTYTVVKGDTLSMLAKKYNTTVDVLVNLNGIRNKDLIIIGQKLQIPNNVAESYYKKYEGNTVSIVDALKSIGVNSTYDYRAKIAAKNGITNYTGTREQNTNMLNMLKQGKLIKI